MEGGFPAAGLARWYAIRVAPGRERGIVRLLERRGVLLYLPLVDRCIIVRTAKGKQARVMQWAMFPGYLFVYSLGLDWETVLATPGVRGVVREGGQIFVIPDRFIAALWQDELELSDTDYRLMASRIRALEEEEWEPNPKAGRRGRRGHKKRWRKKL